ncbi:CotH kinase family protein [Paenibacillus antibioticophila]|uniref:CotH kinase family protein n=1 Tax=Paenibacillus antibioticophila TaxID=1274374 RepID=UPI0037095471
MTQDSGSQATVSKTEQKLNEEVFPKDKVVDVKITIDSEDFQDMLDNASAEEYKQASVDYNGQHFEHIGIRTKGNLSLRSVVQMPDSDRYSFKLSFDEYVDQTLDGISKINLNNNYSDASSMREFLTYELAEQLGLPTPKYSYVNVYINDELWGFYLAIEQIGDAYLNRHFGNSYGALYKGEMTGSGSDLTWLGDDPSAYTGLALKSKTTNDDILIDMINELNNGSDYEKVLDVEESLKYIALNVATNNMDSYIGQNKQNYYLYEDDGIFSILPWDYNMAFGGLGGGMPGGMGGFGGFGNRGGNEDESTPEPPGGGSTDSTDPAGQSEPQETAAPAFGRASGSSLLIDEPTQGAVADRPLVAKLLEVQEYKELYHSILQEAVDGYLSNDTFTARVNELAAMISPYVQADPNAFYSYEEFQAAVPSLIATNASQVENISQQLDGTIPSSGDGSGSGGGMGGFGGDMNRNRGQNNTTASQGEAEGLFPAFGGQMPQGQAPGGQTEGQIPEWNGQPGGGGRGDFSFDFGFGQENGARRGAASAEGAVATGASLLFLLSAAGFVAFFKRKR